MMQRLAEQKQQRIISARGTFNHPLYQIKPKNVMLDTEMIKLSPSHFEKKKRNDKSRKKNDRDRARKIEKEKRRQPTRKGERWGEWRQMSTDKVKGERKENENGNVG